RDRSVKLYPLEDAMAELHAYLPAADATAIYARLDAFAQAAPADDGRSMDQRRADVFTDLLLGTPVPTTGARATTNVNVQVTVPAGPWNTPTAYTSEPPLMDAATAANPNPSPNQWPHRRRRHRPSRKTTHHHSDLVAAIKRRSRAASVSRAGRAGPGCWRLGGSVRRPSARRVRRPGW